MLTKLVLATALAGTAVPARFLRANEAALLAL
jgi:hypothetical protein